MGFRPSLPDSLPAIGPSRASPPHRPRLRPRPPRPHPVRRHRPPRRRSPLRPRAAHRHCPVQPAKVLRRWPATPSSASTATPAAIRCAWSPAAGRCSTGATMLEKRAHFLAEYDWIRTGLMFEPRGHDVMSGSILYPPRRPDHDVAILFIETSGCLPMCGHGTIGTVTMAIEQGLVAPEDPRHPAPRQPRPASWSPNTGRRARTSRRSASPTSPSYLARHRPRGRLPRPRPS